MKQTQPETAERSLLFVQLGFGGIGGIAAVSRALSDGLAQLGHRSTCIRHGTRAELEDGKRSWDGLNVAASLPRRGKINARALIKCANTIRRLRPDVVVAHDHSLIPAAFVGFVLARRRPRIIMVEHQPIGLRSRGTNARSLIGLLFASALICLTADYAQRYPFRRLPLRAIRRLKVIPNAVDSTFFTPATTKTSHEGQSIIGMAARFIPTKDIRSLISAVALLNAGDSGHRYILELAGDGPCQDELIKHAQTSGSARNVIFVGKLDEPGLVAFYHRIDIYVQATFGETFSTSVLQAMACGVPVVASDVEGISNLLDDGTNALLVPAENPDALCATLRELLADPAMQAQLGMNGRSLVTDQYGLSFVAMQYLEISA